VSAAAAAAVLLLAVATSRAAPPTVEYLHPAGGQQGATVAVTAGGKFERWPVQAWADHPGVKVEPAAEKGKLNVTIDKGVPPGPHLLRLYDAEGPSIPLVFVVGTLRESAEAEPNDEAARAQVVDPAPLVLNGRLEKSGDVDSYAVKLEAGQWLCAALAARRLGAPIDPLLHLCDAAGNQIAFTHDGLGLDAMLVHRAEKAGTYVVRVAAFKHPPAADVKLAGEASAVYRLTLSHTAPVRYAIPAGATRGTRATVRLFAWNGTEAGVCEIDARGVEGESAELATDGCDTGLTLVLGDGPELAEADVNASQGTAPLGVPVALTGRIARDGEEDLYLFAAKKGEKINFTLGAAALACPIDAVLRVEDEAGKTLASNDDARGASGDARLEWTAPADGTYRAIVSDLFGHGGQEFVYRLALQGPPRGVVATVDADEFKVAAGKSVAVTVNVTRPEGPVGPLVALATGLPPGVSGTAAEVPEKGGKVTLTLTAAADAKPTAGPLRVSVVSADPARPAAWAAAAGLRTETGQELVARTLVLWLTVLPSK
jgi:hypothetical protein